MTLETAKKLTEFILEKSANDHIYLRWFGGEPLCNQTVIDYICSTLKDQNRQFSSSIVTNAYLFDKETAIKAKNNWNVKNIQITLDGTQDVYNRVKNYKNNDTNPYITVLDNIENLLKLNLNVSLRFNFDLYNIAEIEALIIELTTRFSRYNTLSMFTTPIYENIGACKHNRTLETRKKITEAFVRLEELISNNGFKRKSTINDRVKYSCCMADNKNTILVAPDGNFGYCEHYPLKDHFASIDNYKPKTRWSDLILPDKNCADCVAYPTCLRLEKCFEGRKECFEYERILRCNRIREGMINKYNQVKNNEI